MMIGMALVPDIVGCQRQQTDCASHPIIGNGGEEFLKCGRLKRGTQYARMSRISEITMIIPALRRCVVYTLHHGSQRHGVGACVSGCQVWQVQLSCGPQEAVARGGLLHCADNWPNVSEAT